MACIHNLMYTKSSLRGLLFWFVLSYFFSIFSRSYFSQSALEWISIFSPLSCSVNFFFFFCCAYVLFVSEYFSRTSKYFMWGKHLFLLYLQGTNVQSSLYRKKFQDLSYNDSLSGFVCAWKLFFDSVWQNYIQTKWVSNLSLLNLFHSLIYILDYPQPFFLAVVL